MTALVVRKIKGFLKTTGMISVAQSLKNEGFKSTLKRYGWKFLLLVFVFYLVRDITIYILIPWALARHFIGG